MTFVFLHVPKTGGTSFTTLLQRQFGSGETLRYSVFAYGLRRPLEPFLADLGKKRWKAVAGHIPLTTVQEHVPDAVVATALRHPVDRWMSYYHQGRQHPRYPAKGLGLEETIDYCERVEPEVFNHATELIGDGDVDVAIERLAGLRFVGFTERLQELYDRVAAELGWKRRRLPQQNAQHGPGEPVAPNPSRRYRKKLPRGVLKRLEARCSDDLALYEKALSSRA